MCAASQWEESGAFLSVLPTGKTTKTLAVKYTSVFFFITKEKEDNLMQVVRLFFFDQAKSRIGQHVHVKP